MARNARARISPKAPVEMETGKAVSATRDREAAHSLRIETRKANEKVLLLVAQATGRKRFAECISWASAKQVIAAVASTISHAASSRRERARRGRIAYARIISQLLPPLRATTSPEMTRPTRNLSVEAEVKTGAERSEARLQARPECAAPAPG